MSGKRVFLSHGAPDRVWARELATALRELGVDVWFDALDIEAGGSISDSLERALRESDIVVMPITRESVNSSNFFFELGAATAMKKRIIPIVAEDVDYSKLPISLSRIRALKLKSSRDTAEELAKALIVQQDEAA